MNHIPSPDLDTINWASIHHSHGTAEKFPQWIRALYGDDRPQQRRALRNLSEYSLHQGTLYDVTPVVIPFLVGVLNLPPRPGHIDVLYLLGEYARCSRWAQDDTPDLSVACSAATVAALPRIMRLCRHPKAEVRKAAYHALCQFERDTHPAIHPTLMQTITREADPLTQNLMAMDLMYRYEERGADPQPSLDDLLPTLTDLMQASRPAPTRAFAALTLLRLQGEATPPAVTETLIEALAAADTHLPQRPTIQILYTIEDLPTTQAVAILSAALDRATDVVARGQVALTLAHVMPEAAPVPDGVIEALEGLLQDPAARERNGEAHIRRYLEAWRGGAAPTPHHLS